MPSALPSDWLWRLPTFARIAIGPMMETAGRIGKLTHDLHVALASDPNDETFAPVHYSLHYQKLISHGMKICWTFPSYNCKKCKQHWSHPCKRKVKPSNAANHKWKGYLPN